LLLPNARDADIAWLFEDAGFPAIGATSAGIANAHGYPEGERIEREEMVGDIARITSVTEVPVTVEPEVKMSGLGGGVRGLERDGVPQRLQPPHKSALDRLAGRWSKYVTPRSW
jgi:hypothetical protein